MEQSCLVMHPQGSRTAVSVKGRPQRCPLAEALITAAETPASDRGRVRGKENKAIKR